MSKNISVYLKTNSYSVQKFTFKTHKTTYTQYERQTMTPITCCQIFEAAILYSEKAMFCFHKVATLQQIKSRGPLRFLAPIKM